MPAVPHTIMCNGGGLFPASSCLWVADDAIERFVVVLIQACLNLPQNA